MVIGTVSVGVVVLQRCLDGDGSSLLSAFTSDGEIHLPRSLSSFHLLSSAPLLRSLAPFIFTSHLLPLTLLGSSLHPCANLSLSAHRLPPISPFLLYAPFLLFLSTLILSSIPLFISLSLGLPPVSLYGD